MQWGGERTPHGPSSMPTHGDLTQDLITRTSAEKKEQTPKRKKKMIGGKTMLNKGEHEEMSILKPGHE